MATAKRKVINANIILYGPPQSGKTSNIQFIHRKLKPSQRGQIAVQAQEGYPQIAYEYLPIELGELKGYDTNLYIYTSPSHDDGLETRLNLLNEAAGVVFIADSTLGRMDDNIESLTNLKEELRYWGIDYDNFPLIFQYNKRDVPGAVTIAELEEQLNPEAKESFEAVASTGHGVRDTFALISKMAVRRVRLKLMAEDGSEEAGGEGRRAPGGEGARSEEEGARRFLSARVGTAAARPVPASDVTLDVAPPPRYDDEDDAEEGAAAEADELEVDEVERRGPEEAPAELSTGSRTGEPAVSREEAPAGDGPGEGAPSIAAPEAAPAKVAEETSGEEAKNVPTEKGRRKDKRGGGRKKEAAPLEPEVKAVEPDDDGSHEPIAEVSMSGTGESFLKTSFSFSQLAPQDEPLEVATFEAGEAFEAGSAEDDEQSEPYAFKETSSEIPDALPQLSLPETPAIEAIRLAGIDEPEVHIQTYADEEDEEDEAPVIRLGTRAVEELQLEEEMLLDEEPILEDEPLEEEEPPVEEPAAAAASFAEAAQENDEFDDEDRSIIATEDELVAVGMNAMGERAGALPPMPPIEARWADKVMPHPLIDDEGEDDLIDSGRVEAYQESREGSAEGVGGGATADLTRPVHLEPDVTRQAGGELEDISEASGQAEEAAASTASEASASELVTPAEDEVLPDMAISPLEAEGERDGGLEAAEESVFEAVVEEPVFQAMVEEPADEGAFAAPVEGEASRGEAAEGAEAGLEAGAGERSSGVAETATGAGAALADDEDEQVFEEEREAVGDSDRLLPSVTGWGEVSRVDARTLVMPVSVRLPGTTRDVQIAVTVKVDLLLEDILAASREAEKSAPRA